MGNSIHILKDALKDSGRRVTHKRGLILDLLRENPGHPDAETIFIKAKKRDPRISLATVYRTLTLLKKTGFVEEHRLGETHAHYEAVGATPHLHFTCLGCGRVIEFETPLLERLKLELQRNHHVDLQHLHVHAGGLCDPCRKKGDSR